MKIKRLDLKKQWRNEKKELLPIINKVLSSGIYIGGKHVDSLERKLAKYCGTKYSVCTNSGTDALTLALHVLGVQRGDEVITQSNSFVASASCISHLGATPIFADVDVNRRLDPIDVEKKITKKTKVILPVHLSGDIGNMDSILNIAKKYKLYVVEDAAQSIGSKLNHRRSGSFGDIGCFSAHPLKNLNAAGDAGFIVTNKKSYYDKIKLLINHGMKSRGNSKFYGYVSRMDNLQAAILEYRLKALNKKILLRRKIASLYFSELKLSPVVLPFEEANKINSYHLFVIQVDKRNKLKKFLQANGIETAIHYPIPIHKQEVNSSTKNFFLKNTELQSKRILSLPIHEYLKRNEILYICNKIKEFFNLN
jgi:dTDP-4-amino-4,6-dideoxygalactose transaminase